MIMKSIFSTILVTALFLCSCQQKPVEVQQVDTEAVKVQVSDVMVKYESSLTAKDVSQINLLYSEDLLYVGTDPSEFWGKEAMMGYWEQAFADTSFAMDYPVDKRDIKVAGDGKSAIVVEQLYAKEWSSKIPLRFVYHLVEAEGGWVIDFASVAFIPKNEEVALLNSALELPD